MGRRSCHWPHVSVSGRTDGQSCKWSYLVTEPTHSGSNRLLLDYKPGMLSVRSLDEMFKKLHTDTICHF